MTIMPYISKLKLPDNSIQLIKDTEARGLIDTLENTKQDTLISQQNIKTINGNSILGSGNIDISGGGGEPNFYLKRAAASGNTLTLYNKDESTVVYAPSIPELIAANVSYDNSHSSLISVNVQAALDEVSGSIDTINGDITTINGEIDNINALLGDIASILDEINGEVV